MNIFQIWWDDLTGQTTYQARTQMDRIEASLNNIERLLVKIMATETQLLDLLAQANDQTNIIATELQTLLNQPGVPDSVATAAQALVDRLKGVAAETPQ